MFFSGRRYTSSNIYSSDRKHALRKTTYLQNRNPVLIAFCLRRKSLYSQQCVQLPHQFDALSNPKHGAETNAIEVTPPSTGQLEKRTSSRATDVV